MKALRICDKMKEYLSLFCFTDGPAESNAQCTNASIRKGTSQARIGKKPVSKHT